MRTLKQSVKQLVILSGKGGTGKTSLAASLIHLSSLAGENAVYVDADVDASNLALVVEADPQETQPFGGSLIANIDPQLCVKCGKCFDICRFDAITEPKNGQESYQVIDLLCEGCSSCYYACPEGAIQMIQQQDGEWYHAVTPYGHLFHAELFPGAENTGKLVTTIKQHAKLYAEDHKLPLMLIDGPPGIGCPVISASAGASLGLLVAEPGVSGLHDLERIIKTLAHFKIPIMICINKADLYPVGTQTIYDLAESLHIHIIGEIPFDNAIPQAMVLGKPITRFAPDSPASIAIQHIWKTIHSVLMEGGDI